MRRMLLIGFAALMVSGPATVLGGPRGIAWSATAKASKSITIGNIGWDEDVAANNVLKILLKQKYGIDAKLQLADAGLLYEGVSTGHVDVFMDTWLPNTQKLYWSKYAGKLVKLRPWYHGDANIGLAVPNYSPAKSIADLKKYSSQFGGKITGIEAGAGEMNVVKTKVIPGYGLNYSLLASSTPAMLSALKGAVSSKKEIVVTAWKPHWMFTAYPIRYLSDPKGLMGKTEQLSAIVRKGFQKDQPQAYKLISHFSLNASQLGTLELQINKMGPAKGAQTWLNAHKSLEKMWLGK